MADTSGAKFPLDRLGKRTDDSRCRPVLVKQSAVGGVSNAINLKSEAA